jgi:hypothetical protein
MENSMIDKLIILNGYQANYEFEVGGEYLYYGTVTSIVDCIATTAYRFLITLEYGREIYVDALNVVVILQARGK